MKKKHYIVQVGSQEIKIWAEDSDKAIEKAKDIYRRRLYLVGKPEPIAWIVNVEE